MYHTPVPTCVFLSAFLAAASAVRTLSSLHHARFASRVQLCNPPLLCTSRRLSWQRELQLHKRVLLCSASTVPPL
uniref:Putative secreted protein n=1 Tax=Anopheles darlingi TaxID=43151 RepID=A0A2M4DBB6_ANODA